MENLYKNKIGWFTYGGGNDKMYSYVSCKMTAQLSRIICAAEALLKSAGRKDEFNE